MSANRYGVLGGYSLNKALSCLERDVYTPVFYFPKTSLSSAGNVCPALPFDCPEGGNKLVYEAVSREINGELLPHIARHDADLIFIDFSDEIYDYIVFDDGRVAQKNNYYSKLFGSALPSGARLVSRNSDEAWALWRAGCHRFINSFSGKLVLVKIFFPECFSDGNTVSNFSSGVADKIGGYNDILARCYREFYEITQCLTVDIDKEWFVTQTPEASGINFYDFSDSLLYKICKRIVEIAALGEDALKITIENRVENLFDIFGAVLDAGDIPTIFELHSMGQRYLDANDSKNAKRCERLITFLRNSSVPLSVKMGKVQFGYGGIGVVVHSNCIIGDYVNIGANVTLGGGRGNSLDNRKVPKIADRVYIGAGSKLIGGINIGTHSIIGVNSVVNRDVLPFSVVAGNPAQLVTRITSENVHKYASYLYKRLTIDEAKKLMLANGMSA